MQPVSENISRVLALLTHAPLRLEKATRGLQTTQLSVRSDAEPWSVSDILAHLRACSDVWGTSIITMITRDNPTLRYVSPRSWMNKPTYREQAFDVALVSFTEERQKLVKALTELDEVGWLRRATFTGVSAPARSATVAHPKHGRHTGAWWTPAVHLAS
jgi:hypothetical protein